MSADTSTRHKFIKKLKFAVGRPKNSKDVLKTLDRKKKGFQGNKKSQSRTDENVDVAPYDDKLYRGENGGKNKLKSSMKDKHIHPGREGYGVDIDGKSGFKPVSSDRKRKRIYADQDTREEGTLRNDVEAPNRKALPREGWNRLKDDFVKEKRTVKGRSRDSELSNRKNSSTGRRNSDANTTLDEKSSSKSLRSLGAHKRKEDSILDSRHSFAKLKDKAGSAKLLGVKLRTKGKLVDKMESVKMDGGGNGLLKKLTKSKSDLSKHLDQSQNGRPNVSLWKSSKKAVRDKKSLDGDSVDMEDQPMKSKRVIRIDPHDITNKRLDDGIVFSESTKAKKENLEKNVEISKNAQFRAIQPSPSILSFVEDNLLGRRRLIELRRAGYNIELSAPLDNVPLSTSSERERIEEPIFRNKLAFFAAAKISSSFPDPDLPEIAFAGRSNVGKSSLLNALTRQWGVVRTSDKPGLTQTINFFKLGSKLCMVDLPGYGFAYAKEEVKDAWEELVKEYVSTRVDLKRVCLLIDTKWGMKPRDHELIDLMERSQTKYQIVLTKTDTVFPIDVARRAMQIEESLKAKKSVVQPLMMVSSKSGAGIPSLRTVLAKIARFAKL